MTTEFYLVVISLGFSLLTLVGLYIGWRSFRVFLLRLDLLAIRNQLWDEARALNCLDDEIYRSYRDKLNLMVKFAHRIDLVSLAISAVYSREESRLPESDNPALQAALDRSLAEVSRCMRRYIFWHRPFTGILLVWSVSICAKLAKLCYKVHQFSSGVTKPSCVQIWQFGRCPDQKTREWFTHDGPTIALSNYRNATSSDIHNGSFSLTNSC